MAISCKICLQLGLVNVCCFISPNWPSQFYVDEKLQKSSVDFHGWLDFPKMWGCRTVTTALYFTTPSILAFVLGEQVATLVLWKKSKIHLNYFDILSVSLA
jgi:hypothetical protein